MYKQPILQLSCTLTGRGWVEASLSDGINSATLTASYLSDALSDLLSIVISLLEGAEEGRCLWEEEPGEYRWLFSRKEEQIQVRIIWFKKTFSHQLDEAGDSILDMECSLLKFATKLNRQLDHLLSTWEYEGYSNTWGYAFPGAEHQKLKQLLART